MSNKIRKQQRQEARKRKLEEQPKLLRSSWINFNKFLIVQKNPDNDVSNDDGKKNDQIAWY